MPLMKSKSKDAFSHNVKAEMHAGKPMKQSLAIAYATKRRSKSKGGMVEQLTKTKPSEYAEGGMVEDELNDEQDREESPFEDPTEEQEDFLASSPDPKPNMSDIIKKIRRRKMDE
jgi:hypothetical protein